MGKRLNIVPARPYPLNFSTEELLVIEAALAKVRAELKRRLKAQPGEEK